MGHPVDEELVKLANEEVALLRTEVDQMKERDAKERRRLTASLQRVDEAIQDSKLEFEKLSQKVDDIESKVGDVEDQVQSTDARLTTAIEDHQKLEERVENLERNDKASPQKKTFTFCAPDRNPYFCGRTEKLDILSKHLGAIEGDVCKTSAICGLGGTGKTSLAVEHIWLQKEAYKGGVFWISGDTKRAFQLSVSDMARRLGLDPEERSEFSETLSRTLNWLQRTEELFCLVVNNLDEMELSDEMVKIFRGHWRRGTKGHIVVTSRREPREICEDVGIEEEQCIELRNLTEDEGVQFLKMRTRTEDAKEDRTIRELFNELGGLPLALEQAAAYIRCVRSDFASYLAKYKKEKLSLLKKRQVPRSVADTSKDRLAVHTTWTLNFDYVSHMSEERGFGQAAALVMDIFAFLAPDDIPIAVINQGLPPVENKGLRAIDCLDANELVSILTRFSLFQRNSASSYSVHRLVQEVIRNRLDDDRVVEVLTSAVRMLHFSFCNTTSPRQVCTELQESVVLARDSYPSLQLWGRLGLHACALQDHVLRFAEGNRSSCDALLYTEETARLLNDASVYFDISRETAQAFELQRKKLELLMHLKNPPPEERMEVLKTRAVPLTDRDFRLIHQCMKQSESSGTTEFGDPEQSQRAAKESEELRLQGNQAIKAKDFHKALDLYTKAITVCAGDHLLFSNRALCYLKMNRPAEALEDCESCLKLSPTFAKALYRRAKALHELVKSGEKHLKSRAQAAADLAVYLDSSLSKELSKMFSSFSPVFVNGPLHLTQVLLLPLPGMTILLQEGTYDLPSLFLYQDVQIVGFGAGATLQCRDFSVTSCTCYFENVCVPKRGGAIVCRDGAVVSLFKCSISGGGTSCEEYPECNGGPGCVAGQPCDRKGNFGSTETSGIGGYPGVQILQKSTCYIDTCQLDHCGGGAMLVYGEGSVGHAQNCEVFQNHQAGLEAREGGRLIAKNNKIYGNGRHGVLIGPQAGSCEIMGNKIFENSYEGIFISDTVEDVNVEGNDVYHNAHFGLSLELCTLVINKNRIYENGFWGVLAKSRTNAHITENVIFSNKCGGVFIGVNYSGRTYLEDNVIRDHTEEGLHCESLDLSLPEPGDENFWKGLVPSGEASYYSQPPVLRSNKIYNNEETVRHPREKLQKNRKECSYCHRQASDADLIYCSKCNVAAYCSRDCQRVGSKKHKALCAVIASQYSVSVELKPRVDGEGVITRTFGPHLKGIGEGPKLNPKSHKRFIVKIQTNQLNGHPLQLLSVYDRSLTIDCGIQSPEAFRIVMECGVLGKFYKFTSKKAYFWAVFAEGGKKVTIFLSDLPTLQEW